MPKTFGVLAVLVLAATALAGDAEKEKRKQEKLIHESLNKLKEFSEAGFIWAANHKGLMPEDVAQLIAGGLLQSQQLVSPRVGKTKPAALNAEDLAAGKKEWRKLAEKLEGHTDYVFYSKDLDVGKKCFPADIIMGWEKPEAFADRICVVFLDGHCEAVEITSVTKLFITNNRAREEAGFPTIVIKDGLPVAPKPK
jgi:hypothetical protein